MTAADHIPQVGDTLTTAEELDALPDRAIIRIDGDSGAAAMKFEGWWIIAGIDDPMGSDSMTGGASFTVLHTPGHTPPPIDTEDRQEPPMWWIGRCEDDTYALYTEALADRDRARTIAVHLEQENAELRAERLRFAADYAELRAETETVHGVIEQVGLMVENWDYRYVREELQAILDGATFAEVRDG